MNSVTVIGMSCEHCRSAVKNALLDLGLRDVSVDLVSGVASFAPSDEVTAKQIEEAVDEAGFSVGSMQ